MSEPFVGTTQVAEHVTSLRLLRPPHNYFSTEMISEIADALEHLDEDDSCR
ncbi:MAG: enoyl-CoA hydratase/isomerase family protein, partial [Ilumatobacteraceae bacterium]|nr:enoyl-CoA hydratase/isomerase family protein [Ilumatobacteraceae bacterium]